MRDEQRQAYLASLGWQTFSPNGNSCVEVAHDFAAGLTFVRDSKNGADGPVLQFDDIEWGVFVRDARDGKYDFGLVPPRMIGLTTD